MYLGVIVLLMLVLPLLSVAALPASSPAAFLSFPRKRESSNPLHRFATAILREKLW